MGEHFPFRPEEAVLLNRESLITRKNIFCFFLRTSRTLFYHVNILKKKKTFCKTKLQLLYMVYISSKVLKNPYI